MLFGNTPWDSACGVNAACAIAREAYARRSLRKESLRHFKERSFHIVSTCSGRLDDFIHGEALENYAQHDQNNCECTIN